MLIPLFESIMVRLQTPRKMDFVPAVRLIQLVLFLFPVGAIADEPPIPEGWIRTAPTMDEETKRCRKVYREPAWEVRSANGRLSISAHDHESDLVIPEELEERIKRHDWGLRSFGPDGWVPIKLSSAEAVESVPGGWLVGFDKGEWGGGLWWVPKHGAPKRLYDKNTKHLFRWGKGLYGAGNSYGPVNGYGFLLKLRNIDRGWVVGNILKLSNGFAAGAVLDAERLIVIGSKPSIVYQTGKIVSQPGVGEDWMFARSIAALGGNRFAVGMKLAVAELELRGDRLHEISLLVREDCVRLRRIPNIEHFRCRCVPASE